MSNTQLLIHLKDELKNKNDEIEYLKNLQFTLERKIQFLERKTSEGASELKRVNGILEAMINSLEEGFFVFNRKGLCLPIYSRTCENLIESNPSGLFIFEVLKIPSEARSQFEDWLNLLFTEPLPFEDIALLGPKEFEHSKGKIIELKYYPMRLESGIIDRIIVVVKDSTKEFEASKIAERESAFSKRVIKFIKNKSAFKLFILDSIRIFNDLDKELLIHSCHEKNLYYKNLNLELILRMAHTFKGGAASFEIFEVLEFVNQFEDILLNIKKNIIQDDCILSLKALVINMRSTLKEVIDHFSDLLGESLLEDHEKIEIPLIQLKELLVEMSKFKECEFIYKKAVDDFLKEPIQIFFNEFLEMIQVETVKLGKNVAKVEIIGGDLKIFNKPYLKLFRSFVHIFRNIIDHGIETSHERKEKGKLIDGHIKIIFSYFFHNHSKNKWIKIEIEDDGRGIDLVKIKERIKKTQPDICFSDKTDHQIIQYIFDPYVSTSEEVTELSGRGIGMNAVKFEVEELGGCIEVYSKPNHGTQLVIKIPYIECADLLFDQAA